MQTLIILVKNVEVCGGPRLVITIDGSSQTVALPGPDKTKSPNQRRNHNESVPAFWTWFVENPRPLVKGNLVRRETAS